ncbi:alcohol dehydrogenase-like domain-containing protein [Stagonosporopsis vannaccii]|nr:alcohol dehydrogenase-like domain-containing protein [Stagonosporopsis vannaccii]
MLSLEYPAVLGSPIAGVVKSLGPNVSRVAIGQRVVCGTKIFTQKKAKYGGLQQFAVVDESEVLEIGDVEFTKVVTLGSYTPPGALFSKSGLNLHWPTIPASPLPDSEQQKKVLIWGGSSAMGSLSISYAKQAGYTVISTSSKHNLDLLKSLGADYVFDHSDPATVNAIRNIFPIDYWFDTISLNSTVSTILDILAPEGEPVTEANILLLLPPAWLGIDNFPKGITTQFYRFSTHAPENAEWRKHFLGRDGFMEQGLKNGIITGVPPEVLGGLDKAEAGIDAVWKGVSAKKIVIEPWA